MYCKNCGTPNHATTQFCASCGAKMGIDVLQQSEGNAPDRGNFSGGTPGASATTALVLSIISLVLPIIGEIISFSIIANNTTTTVWGVTGNIPDSAYSIPAFIQLIGLAAGIVGIILAAKSMKELKFAGLPAGKAIAALVCGIVGTVWNFLCVGCNTLLCVANDAVGSFW
jgi:hypothetical protein